MNDRTISFARRKVYHALYAAGVTPDLQHPMVSQIAQVCSKAQVVRLTTIRARWSIMIFDDLLDTMKAKSSDLVELLDTVSVYVRRTLASLESA